MFKLSLENVGNVKYFYATLYLFYQSTEVLIVLNSEQVKPSQNCHEVEEMWHHILC